MGRGFGIWDWGFVDHEDQTAENAEIAEAPELKITTAVSIAPTLSAPLIDYCSGAQERDGNSRCFCNHQRRGGFANP
jgi:hypothetical protein